MTTLVGSAQVALQFLDNFIGQWGYDHDAGARTRFGPAVWGGHWDTHSTIRVADCSGAVIRGLVESGMPRYHEGFPESSGDMNRWADNHPDLLLWSIHGGGRYPTLFEAIVHAPPGVIFGIGDYKNGDAGHTGFLYRPDGTTTESASGLRGLKHGTISRFGGREAVTHLYLAPVNYGTMPRPLTPEELAAFAAALEELDVEHGMAVDFILHPHDPNSGYTLDRWGGVGAFGAALPVQSSGYWPGKDVARTLRVVDWAAGTGYVMDLDGGLHGFAPKGTPTPPNVKSPYFKGGKVVDINEVGS